jgi:hypothetical protein
LGLRFVKDEKIFFANVIRLCKKKCLCLTLEEYLYNIMKKELGDKCEISEHSLRKSVKQLYDSIYKWLDHGCLRGVDNFIDDIQNIADYFKFMSSVVDVKALWLKSLQQKN